MRRLAAPLLLIALALPVQAQPLDKGGDAREGADLIERGAGMIMRQLLREMEPALDDLTQLMDEIGPQMQQMIKQMGPKLEELLARIDDIRHYEAPELLPNGDILIRRKPDAPTFEPSAPDSEIEL